MEIKKRNRVELKSYFVKNAIPTESNFGDFIDAAINQKDDGIVKLPGNPLSIEASGDATSQKKAINFFDSFSDDNPAWVISLNPRSNPGNANTAKRGFSVSDAAGNSRLFIENGSGHIGIGTVAPTRILHVRADNEVGLFESTSNQAVLRLSTTGGADHQALMINRPGGRLAVRVGTGSDTLNVLQDGKVGIRHTDPTRQLHVGGTCQISLLSGSSISTDSQAGIYWHTNDDYGIFRTPGAWTSNTYQQLKVKWRTGVIIEPGTGAGAGHDKSYVHIREGKGLRVTDGTVGIGTPTTSHIFHVRADSAVGLFESTSNMAYLRFSTSEGMRNRVEIANRAGGRLALWVGTGGDALNILKDGKVGVGRTDPKRQFHVGGSCQISLMKDSSVANDSQAGIFWHDNNEYGIYRTPGAWTSNTYQQLRVNWRTGIIMVPGTGDNKGHDRSYVNITGGKGLRVTQGTVAIGTTNPGSFKLRVQAGSNHMQISRPRPNSSGGTILFLELVQEDKSGPDVPVVYPSIRFHHGYRFWHRIEGREKGFHFKDGNLGSDAYSNVKASKFNTSSSRALKDNISDLGSDEAMAALASLNPVRFTLRDDPDKYEQLGFIAEDVPDLVAVPDREAVDAMEIVAVLTKVVKRQQTLIDRLVAAQGSSES